MSLQSNCQLGLLSSEGLTRAAGSSSNMAPSHEGQLVFVVSGVPEFSPMLLLIFHGLCPWPLLRDHLDFFTWLLGSNSERGRKYASEWKRAPKREALVFSQPNIRSEIPSLLLCCVHGKWVKKSSLDWGKVDHTRAWRSGGEDHLKGCPPQCMIKNQ